MEEAGLVIFIKKKSFVLQLEIILQCKHPDRTGLLNSERLTLHHSMIRKWNHRKNEETKQLNMLITKPWENQIVHKKNTGGLWVNFNCF